MGKPTAFMELGRKTDAYRPVEQRVDDFRELYEPLPEQARRQQSGRCMDCGVPFCQSNHGCPLCNHIPDWNDLVFRGRYHDAYLQLALTNNFPEFTGRVCPAVCEGACSLQLYSDAMTNRNNERFIAETAFEQGWVQTPGAPGSPGTPGAPGAPALERDRRTGKKIAVIGSGPAGLAAADQLNKAGHDVTVFERADRFGGLLMYGIPNMKLDKHVVERRVALMHEEGVHFISGAHVGVNVDARALYDHFDALVLATGATHPRDMDVPGRELHGVHFAVDFLTQTTRSLLRSNLQDGDYLSAQGKHVVVIGGGDTGNDCIGTAIRHGCQSVTNLELLPPPPDQRDTASNPWPQWPKVMRTDYGHCEAIEKFGADPRHFNILTKRFLTDDRGHVRGIETVQVKWSSVPVNGRPAMSEVPDSTRVFAADLVLLALGFLGPEATLAQKLGIELDERTNFKASGAPATTGSYATSLPGVFAAGDCRRGQSLVAWAINEGRACARAVDLHLMGHSDLPAPGVNVRSAAVYA
jgi:NAD(P)H-dependent glutamate synthase small subunit